MSRARNFLTGTALALVLVSAPVLAQDAAADPEVTAAYQTYASALAQLKSGINSGGDVNAQYEAAEAARAELMAACAAAGTPELAVCVETYVSADMRVEGDVTPLPEPPMAEEAPAEPVEDVIGEPEEAVEPEQAAPEEPVEDAPADVAPEAAEQTEESEPSPEAEETVDDSEAPMDPEADAQVDGETAVEAAPEADVDAEVDVDAGAEVETEAPEAEADPVSDGADVQAAYAAYAEARTALATARENEGDVTSAAQQVNVAFESVVEACETIGAADLAACLDQYISSDARLDNDLSRIEVPEPDATADGEAEAEGEAPDPEDVAPVLDSEKEEEAETGVETDGSADAEADADASAEDNASEASEPAPQSDEEAQADVQTEQVQSSQAEQGEEISADEGREATRRGGAPEQAEVVEQNNFRIVFRFGNQLVVRNQDNTRLGYDAEDTRYERLGNGRFRETIFRENGSQLITIYNRNGDILQRSVIEPDGTEYFLFYTPEDRYDDVLEWRDPAEDLPPLRLTIPADQYVLDARTADEQRIYQFLGQPPVERIDRLYSVDEVQRSARLRDVMRRLEIGDLTFDTGSAALSADQFGSLNIVAGAMHQLLADNPREVFLIEGHTDAVGSDVANLALSDRRAETVAIVLTQTFGIPAENLVTQGYGERYLAVRTEGPERLNRRVTAKRITPLVSPRVAAAG